MSIVPVAGAEKKFCTQVDSVPFTIGSGVPKTQPVLVHLNPAPSASVAPSVQLEPLQLVVKR
ncbi:MAG TPA: hypothetical protein VKE41_03370, partial [Roseiflexaceae bacterium]|nr:hypothetical protein [Roseiflexaceae bacterium]